MISLSTRVRDIRRAASLTPAALAYLAGVTLAELLTTYADPRLGIAAHCLLLALLLYHCSQAGRPEERAFLLSLAFAPLIRILSLSLPLASFPRAYWYLITGVPLFASAFVAARTLGYTWPGLGLTPCGWPLQIIVGLSGLAFGTGEYLILRPETLARALAWQQLWAPALILLVFTGLLEEIIFRGLLQRASIDALGRCGVPYVAVLFAVLHIGYRSVSDLLFVLVVGLFFGVVVERTKSLLGVTLAHGLTNVVLFLISPFLLG